MNRREVLEEMLLRLDQRGDGERFVEGPEVASWGLETTTWLQSIGILAQASPPDTMSCPECGIPHVELVDYEEARRPAIPCPVNGRVEFEPALLQRWRIHLEGFAHYLATRLHERNARVVLQDRCWKIGVAQFDKSRAVFLVRGLSWLGRSTDDPVTRLPAGSIGLHLEALTPAFAPPHVHWVSAASATEVEALSDLLLPQLQLAPSSPLSPDNTFRADGKLWRIQFKNETTTQPARKGFEFIAVLLRNPGVEFTPLDLLSYGTVSTKRPAPGENEALNVSNGHQNDELADSDALKDLRREIARLHAKKSSYGLSAIERDDLARLQAHLNTMTRPGRRTRAFADPAEKSRSSIGKSIRRAIKTLYNPTPLLALHLENSIRTGSRVCYAPDEPLIWVTQ